MIKDGTDRELVRRRGIGALSLVHVRAYREKGVRDAFRSTKDARAYSKLRVEDVRTVFDQFREQHIRRLDHPGF